MKEFLDRSFLTNPITEYLYWLANKTRYQFKHWGKHLRLGYFTVVRNCDFGSYNWIGGRCILINSQFGSYSYVNDYSYILWADIGKFCSIGPNVKIAPGRHPASTFVSTHPVLFNNQGNFVRNYCTEAKFKNYSPVAIGNDVWIGANSIVIDGVSIGDGAIVAANSVVVKNVAPYDIVGGNPARFLRKRFTDSQVAYLLNFKWWDKDFDWIQANVSKFWNIDDFTAL